MKKKREKQKFIALAFLIGILFLGIVAVQTPQTLFSKAATRTKITATPIPKSIYRYRPKPRRLTPTRIPTPTFSPATLRLEVPWQLISNDNDYNASAHFDFYDGSVKKYYGFFYAFASDDKTTKCGGTDIIKDYKSFPIGGQIFITELIPTLYLKSERTDKGVELYFIYQSKRYDLVKFPKSTYIILVGIDNTRIPNVTKLACLED